MDISCGDNFCAAVSKEGKLYTWGYGADGQLGHNNTLDVRTPKLVQINSKISSVSCGGGHTGIITNKQELFLFGRGKEVKKNQN